MLRKAHKLDPMDPEITECIIWGLYASGDYQACVEYTETNKKLDTQTWLLRIASMGAMMMNEDRDRELDLFTTTHGDDEVESHWEELEFNNSAIKQATKHFLFDTGESIEDLIKETKTQTFSLNEV